MENKENQSLKTLKEFALEFIKILVISLAIVIPIRYFLIQPFYVKGASMEPTFHDYEYLIIDEISYRFKMPERGDVVVLHSPYNWNEYYIKRVIGLPGERVVVKDGVVFIYNKQFGSGVKLDESSYLFPGLRTPGSVDLKVGENEYFVMGDNRSASLDSRTFGAISKDQIIGRVLLRGWPISKIGLFSEPIYNF